MSILSIAQLRQLTKAGPFVGPHGGKWADAKHTIPYKAGKVKPGSAEHTKALVRHLEEHHGVRMHVGHGDRLSLSKIVVPKDKRGQGTGGKVMGALHRYADAHGKTVTLTPSTDFGGTKSGLKRFYKKHGYV